MTEIKDIYDGENTSVWTDGEFTFLNIWNMSVSFPNDVWEKIKKELKEIGET